MTEECLDSNSCECVPEIQNGLILATYKTYGECIDKATSTEGLPYFGSRLRRSKAGRDDLARVVPENDQFNMLRQTCTTFVDLIIFLIFIVYITLAFWAKLFQLCHTVVVSFKRSPRSVKYLIGIIAVAVLFYLTKPATVSVQVHLSSSTPKVLTQISDALTLQNFKETLSSVNSYKNEFLKRIRTCDKRKACFRKSPNIITQKVNSKNSNEYSWTIWISKYFSFPSSSSLFKHEPEEKMKSSELPQPLVIIYKNPKYLKNSTSVLKERYFRLTLLNDRGKIIYGAIGKIKIPKVGDTKPSLIFSTAPIILNNY